MGAFVLDALIMSSFGPCHERPSTRASFSGVEPTPLAAKPTKLSRACRARACYSVGLVERFRHPNTIAYPEKFFESAQLIATHSHLRWPDLSREWIRRQQARISRVDWESRLPCVLGPRKSRLSLFTRKQQKLLNKAREMEGIPDLSALLKGKLKMLSSKSSSAGASEARPTPADGDVNSEPPTQSSPKKKTSKAKKQAKKGQSSSLEGSVPLEEAPSSADASEVTAKKKKKKKDSKKRARNDDAGRHDPTDSTRGSPEERPKKKSKKTAVEDGGTLAPEGPSKRGGKATETGDGSRDESPLSKRALSSSARKKGVESGGSLPQMAGKGFPDRVEFLYDETTPLVLNPLRCAELTRQIRERREYELSRREVRQYSEADDDPAGCLGETCGNQAERDREDSAENKKASEKAAKEKEVLRVKFEELEDKLKSDRLAKKDALRRRLGCRRWNAGQREAALEKVELEGERDAVVGTQVKERQRLRDSRIQEVTRERVKVQAAMADKSTRCFGRVKDYLDRLNALEKAKSLYGQASGTKKCLEVIRDSGTEIPQDMIDIVSEQEKLHEAEVAKLRLDPFSKTDFALSPLNLPSRFVSEEFMGMLDPYGSNVGLIGHESASQLITSREATKDPTDEPMIDITSALSKRIAVPEGTAVEECSDKNDSGVGGNAIQEETGDVAAEDPVLVSSSEEREDDEGGDQEENRSSPTLIEEVALNPSASDPPAQIEGPNAQVAEETVGSPDPVVSDKEDQDTVA
ncbi:hypothetical protein IGI04_035903 [Brassica rapa subsp. trilocularis]|uniref:Uncharacterized protein n=1 Tax=Brassica rapa subsp. trilocularis TaxID=1813537 RepID=A0ABQ7LG18_BRACM|nr:hypothetical protein IGI04_035903 [Brassica rapa subsp. trilocularis]